MVPRLLCFRIARMKFKRAKIRVLIGDMWLTIGQLPPDLKRKFKECWRQRRNKEVGKKYESYDVCADPLQCTTYHCAIGWNRDLCLKCA